MTSLHSIFQDEEGLEREEVEAAGLKEDLDVVGLVGTSDSGGQDCDDEEDEEESHEGEEGHE
jgi:hypothetical protein